MLAGCFLFPSPLVAMDEMGDAEMGRLTVGHYLYFTAVTGPAAKPAQSSLQEMTEASMCEVAAGRRPWDEFSPFERELLLDELGDTVTVTEDLTYKVYQRGCDFSFLPIEKVPPDWLPDWQYDSEITELFLKRYRLVEISQIPRLYHYGDHAERHTMEMGHETPFKRYSRYFEKNPMVVDGEPLKVAAVNFIAKIEPAETEFRAVDKSHFDGMLYKKSGCTYRSGYYIVFDY